VPNSNLTVGGGIPLSISDPAIAPAEVSSADSRWVAGAGVFESITVPNSNLTVEGGIPVSISDFSIALDKGSPEASSNSSSLFWFAGACVCEASPRYNCNPSVECGIPSSIRDPAIALDELSREAFSNSFPLSIRGAGIVSTELSCGEFLGGGVLWFAGAELFPV
jgi:hypothetical protein